MNKKQQGGKVMLIGGSLILVGLVVAIIIGVFFKKPTPPAQEEEPKVTYESKETKDLVTTYSSSEKTEVNKDYSKFGVSATISNEEYRNKVQQVSTVVANGFQEVEQVDKDAVFQLLNEAFSTLVVDENDFGSASPALSQFSIMLTDYFGGIQSNPMGSLGVLLTHIKSKVNTVNLSKTSTPGKIAIEFVIEDDKGNQLGYVTGYFGDYTKRFEVTSALPLGYGQDYINKTVPKNFPKSQGVE